MERHFPFTAIVGQNELTASLKLAAVDPAIGGVLAFGDRGTGKSTAVRGLAAILPPLRAYACPYRCDPARQSRLCETCRGALAGGKPPAIIEVPVPVVDLPLGSSEDRIVGGLDLEHALLSGERRFEPGLLAKANRGFLYIDEINLLEDHLVDLLLDVAASGENVVEREGLSVRHPAQFVLIGSGNPEEGELRPQLLDRFGLSVTVTTPGDVETRVAVVKARNRYDRDPAAFMAEAERDEQALRATLRSARTRLDDVMVSDRLLEQATQLCITLQTDGLRAELTLVRAARALASLKGESEVTFAHLAELAPYALSHRLRRNPLEESGSEARIERALAELAAA
ncbi:magnesium chelatase ATPase subunit I [Fulvimarina sp. 2208YS6-2-32]|uniref:Mg-protoporphyrin IX chelatase n=1 Tax=Fulvimarina uroteuthidis TaxID=3098149 RepID=A0ABU5I2S8_9HYPH|nr:magnesium chelatase ATPase subunit I [Fulvimarina sp. 2208YS6-2-32]MDY8108471.1 magnesium chelatase ATPase subunit I [Fulvimarina sp. 2208YS6-2-32]